MFYCAFHAELESKNSLVLLPYFMAKEDDLAFLAHLNHGGRSLSDMCRQLLQRTYPSKLLAGFFTKLVLNDPYMVFYDNCSNGSNPLHN